MCVCVCVCVCVCWGGGGVEVSRLCTQKVLINVSILYYCQVFVIEIDITARWNAVRHQVIYFKQRCIEMLTKLSKFRCDENRKG